MATRDQNYYGGGAQQEYMMEQPTQKPHAGQGQDNYEFPNAPPAGYEQFQGNQQNYEVPHDKPHHAPHHNAQAPQQQQQNSNYQPPPPQQDNYQPPPGPPAGYQQYQEPPQNYEQPHNYPQAPPNYPPSGGAGPSPGKQGTFEEKFSIPKPKYNDWWAGLLFIATFLAFAGISGYCLHSYAVTEGFRGNGIYGGNARLGLTTNTLILFLFVTAVGFLLSLGYLWVARTYTKQLIYITGILNVLFAIGTAVYYFAEKYYSSAIVFLIFGLFSAFCFWSWRSRIPFTVVMLQLVIDVAKTYGHVFITSLIGGIVTLVFSVWFSITLVAVYVKYQPDTGSCSTTGGGCSSGAVIGIIFFITFAAYWITEFIKNAMHVTISGIYGSWFYTGPGDAPVHHPTLGAFRRAITYCFGSIAFGSLLVAILQMLRQITSIAQSDASASGDMIQYVVFCILNCILGLVQWALNFINEYAYSFIGLYGKAYIPAAKETWTLIKDRGIDALIQDCLINPVLTFGSMFVAYTCTLLSYLYLKYTKPEYNSDGGYTPIVMAFSFLIGMQLSQTLLNPLKSGVTTVFVAMAVDPGVLMNNHRDLYDRMIHVYPKVAQAINV